MTASIVIAWLGVVTSVALAVACVAIWRTRAAPGDDDRNLSESIARARTLEADSRLADDVAHDLNDLLTAIAGHAELLIASLDPSSTGIRDAREIRRAALSAARLTKPLRTLSGGDRAPTGVIDVNAVIARTLSALQPMLGPKITVTLTLDEDIKRIRVGASHLEEIVLTLCMYARDAMPDGGRLTVATTMHTYDGRDAPSGVRGTCVRVLVADTGRGMSAAAQSTLFEPLLVSEDAGESAIGLAKVDMIVRQARGRIQVESAVGVGTTFTVDLPATSDPTAGRDGARAEPRPALVLVVEDEPGMRELIRLVLARAGYDVVAVPGPRAALAALHRAPAISLMLVDIVMPEMDGYELVAEARKILPNVHVVFVSAFAPDPTRQSSGDSFLAKPFASESLISIVEKALSD